MIMRALIAFFIVLVIVVVNFFHPSSRERARAFDLAYIAENCAGISDQQAANIGDYVEPMSAFLGTDYYLFEHAPDGTPQNHTLVALRDDYQEALCFPVTGCLIPPIFRGKCLAS